MQIRTHFYFRYFFGVLVAVMGIVNLISSLYPAVMSRREFVSDFISVQIQYGGRLTTVFLGFFLLLLAPYVWRGKKTAFNLILTLLLTSSVTHLIKGFDWEEASIDLILSFLLFRNKKLFLVKSDPIRVSSLPKKALIFLMIIILYGLAGFFILDRHFSSPFYFTTVVTDVLSTVIFFFEPATSHLTYHANRFIFSLYFSGVLWYGFCIAYLLSPVLTKKYTTATEKNRARQFVQQYGQTPLSFFSIHGEKQYFFGDDSFLAYVVIGRVCLVLGDPIGKSETFFELLKEFKKYATENDWVVSLYQVSESLLLLYKGSGFEAFGIGQEGVVKLADFSLEGSDGKVYRNTVTKIDRLGFTIENWTGQVTPFSQKEKLLRSISMEWLEKKKTKEMRFSLGWFSPEFLQDETILVVKNASGTVVAFVTLLPQYGSVETAFDLMRHANGLPNGIMEYLFIQTMLWAKEQGFELLNLGLSPLAGVGGKKSDPFIEKILHTIFHRATRWYNYKGLYQYKAKFNPVWENKYLIYKQATDLPQIGAALLIAHN